MGISIQNDELPIDQGTDQAVTEKPDVYLENDYLVFKNMNEVDSAPFFCIILINKR